MTSVGLNEIRPPKEDTRVGRSIDRRSTLSALPTPSKADAMKTKPMLALPLMLCGCASPPPSQMPRSASSTISPASTVAGSLDLMLTVTGSNFLCGHHKSNQAVRSSNGDQTQLATPVAGSTQLTAVVRANSLIRPVAAQLFVQSGFTRGDLPLTRGHSLSEAYMGESIRYRCERSVRRLS